MWKSFKLSPELPQLQKMKSTVQENLDRFKGKKKAPEPKQAPPPRLEVSGVLGPASASSELNGVYALHESQLGGKPCWRHVAAPDCWVYFDGGSGGWVVGNPEQVPWVESKGGGKWPHPLGQTWVPHGVEVRNC